MSSHSSSCLHIPYYGRGQDNEYTHTHTFCICQTPALGRHLYVVLGTSTQVADVAAAWGSEDLPTRDGRVALSGSMARSIHPSAPPQFGQRRRRRVAKVRRWPYRATIDDFGDHHKRLEWGITRPFVLGLSRYHHRDKPTQSPTSPICVSTPIYISSQTRRTKDG